MTPGPASLFSFTLLVAHSNSKEIKSCRMRLCSVFLFAQLWPAPDWHRVDAFPLKQGYCRSPALQERGQGQHGLAMAFKEEEGRKSSSFLI